MSKKDSDIIQRRDEGIKRALNTPPKKNSELVGMTERAQYAKFMKGRAKLSKDSMKD